jgi:hypothetical protein
MCALRLLQPRGRAVGDVVLEFFRVTRPHALWAAERCLE